MRLLRMCEHEGRADIGAYVALRDDVTIGEALEIEAALVVVGDFRAEFSDFMRDYKPAQSPTSPAHVGELRATPEDLRAELAHRESVLARAQAARMKHRAAIAYAASGQPEPPGRLSHAAIVAVDNAIAAQENAIAALRAQLEPSNGD
jgi:hypothetical protein